jgi:tRNA threonylcarbamoyladenosine biosynthesis protein TsaE
MSADFLLPDEAATEALARKAARGVHSATEPLVLYLQGELGSGKTCFARGMLRELGESGPVRSPTYGLLSEYLTPRGRVVHIDLYRLRSPQEIQTLGLADHLAGSLLWLIEWPEKSAGEGLPAADVRVSIDVIPNGRKIGCVAETAAGHLWVSNLCADSR